MLLSASRLVPLAALVLAMACDGPCYEGDLSETVFGPFDQRAEAVIDCAFGYCFEFDGRVTGEMDESVSYGSVADVQVISRTMSQEARMIVCSAGGVVRVVDWELAPEQWPVIESGFASDFTFGTMDQHQLRCFGEDGGVVFDLDTEQLQVFELPGLGVPADIRGGLALTAEGVLSRVDLDSMQVISVGIEPRGRARSFFYFPDSDIGVVLDDGSLWRWLGDNALEPFGDADEGWTHHVAISERSQWRVSTDGCYRGGLSLDAPDVEGCTETPPLFLVRPILDSRQLQIPCGEAGELQLWDTHRGLTRVIAEPANCTCEMPKGLDQLN